MDRRTQLNAWYLAFTLPAVFALRGLWVGAPRVQSISYSEFQTALDDGRVADVAKETLERNDLEALRDRFAAPGNRVEPRQVARLA